MSSSEGPVHTNNASATYTVAAPVVVPTYTASVGSNKTSYMRGEMAYLTARMLSDGQPVAGAQVSFTISGPMGSKVLTTTTDSDGYARGTYAINRSGNARGSYTLKADMSFQGTSKSATSTFSVL